MPAALDDPTQVPHYRHDMVVPDIAPYTMLLKDGETTATIYPIASADQLPIGLLAFLCDEFNMEIERGDTFPLFDTLHINIFQNYWFGAFAGVMLIGDSPNINDRRQWEKECLGTFYIKPNYPGRCSHICTAGFLVNAGIRGKGIGRTLAECYLDWAPKLGYTYSVFNLVFETNVLARRIWETLNFKRIGRIKGAGILKGLEHSVDALVYGRELVEPANESVGEMRFDKIKFYLETGRYPPQSDRQEKSRLRSSAAHYRLRDGKLMLKDREVVSDPDRQLQIARDIHMQTHAGINKTTSQITDRYHWTRIKDTVALAIRNCGECSESSRPQPKRPKKEYENGLTDTSLNGVDVVDVTQNAAVSALLSATTPNHGHNLVSPGDPGSHQVHVGHQQQHHMQHHPNAGVSMVPGADLQHHSPHDLVRHDLTQSGLLSAAGIHLDGEVDEANLMAAVAHQQHQQHHDQQGSHRQQQQHQRQQQSGVGQDHQQLGGVQQQNNPQAFPLTQQQAEQHQGGSQAAQFQSYYQTQHFSTSPTHDDIPVDPQVESAFEEHVHGSGEDIAIARALIQANESSGADDSNNLFS